MHGSSQKVIRTVSRSSRTNVSRRKEGTKEWSKMLRRILLLEEGKVPAKAAKDWLMEGKEVQITREEYKRLKR